jgi:hypothetical protein
MTVTDGRAGHFRTVSAVVRVRPGAVRQAAGHRPGDRGRAQSAARSYSPGRLPPRRAEGAPPPPLRLSNFGPTSCGLRPRRQPTMETTTALARLDPHATRFALAVARPTYRPLLSGQRHAIALQAERAQLAAISAHPAAMVGALSRPRVRRHSCGLERLLSHGCRASRTTLPDASVRSRHHFWASSTLMIRRVPSFIARGASPACFSS